MRSTAAASVPSSPARPIATDDIVGSCPTTSRVSTVSATSLISSIIVPGRGAVESLAVSHRGVDAGVGQGLAGASGRGAQHGVDGGHVGAQPIAGQAGLRMPRGAKGRSWSATPGG